MSADGTGKLGSLRAWVQRLARARRVGSRRTSRDEQGMTLIEIMLVVAIIAMVMGAVGFVAFSQFQKAQVKNTQSIIKRVEDAVAMYMMENNGECPKELAELHTQKILNKVPKDSWGRELVFTCPGEQNSDGVDVLSTGKDKREGTEDDIKNWDEGGE